MARARHRRAKRHSAPRRVHHRTVHHHRRRRMGAVGRFDMKNPGLTLVGAAGGTYLINNALKTTPYIDVITVAAGLLLPRFVKNPAMVPIGAGLVAAGGISLLQNAKVISGMGRGMMGRVMVGPGRTLHPISAVAGVAAPPNIPGTMTQRQLAAEMNRRSAATLKQGRVIMGTTGQRGPISSVAGIDDYDL